MTDRQSYQETYRQQYKAQAKRVNLTLSLEEHRALLRAAKASGEKLSGYVKRRALEAHEPQDRAFVPEEVLEQLAELDRLVRTMANNVNQMALHSNRVRQVLDETEPFRYIHRLEGELLAAIAACSRAEGEKAGDHDGAPA